MNEYKVLLKYNNQYYCVSKEYFDISTKTFIPVLINDFATIPLMDLTKLNEDIIINNTHYTPSDYFDFSKSNICIISKEKIKSLQLNYKFLVARNFNILALNSEQIDIFKDRTLEKIYIRFKKDFKYKVYINYLTKENELYINSKSLEVI